MVESTTPQAIRNNIFDASKSDKQYVLTIGDCGHGKSTFNNALLGAHKNEANDAT